MNSYERVMNRLKGRAVDRAPNFCILMNFAAQYSNVCYKDFCLMPEKMVEANLGAAKTLPQILSRSCRTLTAKLWTMV